MSEDDVITVSLSFVVVDSIRFEGNDNKNNSPDLCVDFFSF